MRLNLRTRTRCRLTAFPALTAALLMGTGAASAAVLGLATSAHAAQESTISVSPKVVAAGQAVRISGSTPISGCPADDDAILTATEALFPEAGFGPHVPRDSSGAFSVSYTVPTSTPPGVYRIGFRCGGGNVGVSARLRVTGQVGTVPSGGVATGAGGADRFGAGQWAGAGLGCLALAAILITVRRRLARQLR
jgi:hypothetical protein